MVCGVDAKSPLSHHLGQVLAFVTLPMLVALALTSILSVSALADTARADSRAALVASTTDAVADAAAHAAESWSVALRQYGRALRLLEYALVDAAELDSAADSLDPGYPLDDATVYLSSGSDLPDAATNAGDPRYTEAFSGTHSVYLGDDASGEAQPSQHLDVFMQSLYEGFASVQAVHVCFVSAGDVRVFPGKQPLPAPTDYDCRSDSSHAYARALDNPLDTVFSAPYRDPWSDLDEAPWLLAVSKAVRDSSNDNYAVVSLELRLQDLTATLVEMTFLDSGFAHVVCDDAGVLTDCEGGTVVGSPLFDAAAADDTSLVYELAGSHVSESAWELSGLNEVTDAGEVWFLAAEDVRPAADEDPVFRVLMLAKQAEVFAPLDELDDEIDEAASALATQVMVVVVVVLALLPFVATAVVLMITRPLAWLSEQAERITNNATEENIVADVSSSSSSSSSSLGRLQCRTEVHDLTHQFRQLVMDLASGSSTTASTAETAYVTRAYHTAGLPWHAQGEQSSIPEAQELAVVGSVVGAGGVAVGEEALPMGAAVM